MYLTLSLCTDVSLSHTHPSTPHLCSTPSINYWQVILWASVQENRWKQSLNCEEKMITLLLFVKLHETHLFILDLNWSTRGLKRTWVNQTLSISQLINLQYRWTKTPAGKNLYVCETDGNLPARNATHLHSYVRVSADGIKAWLWITCEYNSDTSVRRSTERVLPQMWTHEWSDSRSQTHTRTSMSELI